MARLNENLHTRSQTQNDSVQFSHLDTLLPESSGNAVSSENVVDTFAIFVVKFSLCAVSKSGMTHDCGTNHDFPSMLCQ